MQVLMGLLAVGIAGAVGFAFILAWSMGSVNLYRSAAAWMLAPYLAWVTFAGALNFAIWRLNRARTLLRE